MQLLSEAPTCTEPGNVPGQNCVDPEAAACRLNWDRRDVPMDWGPAHKQQKRSQLTEDNRQPDRQLCANRSRNKSQNYNMKPDNFSNKTIKMSVRQLNQHRFKTSGMSTLLHTFKAQHKRELTDSQKNLSVLLLSRQTPDITVSSAVALSVTSSRLCVVDTSILDRRRKKQNNIKVVILESLYPK